MKLLSLKTLYVEINGNKILNIPSKIEIFENDKVAVIGENGSGKSTLVHAILDEIHFEGEITRNFQKKDCGIVFQNNSYHELMKVIDLIRIALSLTKKEVSSFLIEFDLEHLRKKYIKDLSGGERQRLTLSLVLASEKKIYFFDELSAGLDYKKRVTLLALIRKRTMNSTVLNITHYFDEIEEWATKILVLKNGDLLFWGSISDFFYKFFHYSIVKIDYTDLNQIIIDDIVTTDTGDAVVLFCDCLEYQITRENELRKNNVSFKTIKQNIYTTYLKANLNSPEKKSLQNTEVNG